MIIDPVIHYTITLSLSALFMLASVNKLRYINEFKQAISAYRLLPNKLNAIVAHALPLVEVLCAIALMLPNVETIGISFAICLLLCYAGAMTIKLVQGEQKIDCGCQLTTHTSANNITTISTALVARNLILAVFAALAFIPVEGRSIHWMDFALISFGLAIFSLLFATCNQLIQNHTRYQEIA